MSDALNPSNEAHLLVIKHLKVLEDAPTIVEEIEKAVFAAIDHTVAQWVEGQPDEWDGVYEAVNDGTYFQPDSWGLNEKGEYFAYYQLRRHDPAETLRYPLSALLGAADQQYGLSFDLDVIKMTGAKTLRKAEKAWIAFLERELPATGLEDLGFRIGANYLFLPMRVDAMALAENYPDSVGPALKPALDRLLETLEVAHPKFNDLFVRARQYFDGLAAALNHSEQAGERA